MLSVIVPVFRNEASVPALIESLERLGDAVRARHDMALEVVFVVDASPDRSLELLEQRLPAAGFASRLMLHSRNFGSFAAIRTGMAAATGEYFGVLAADLQEPPELMLAFLERLASESFDVVVGRREGRDDPAVIRVTSGVFWRLYRTLVIPDMPASGVDVFACNRRFRDHLLRLEEAHSSLVGLLFWLGFRRAEVPYRRLPRTYGKSAWTTGKRITYLLDSVFSFTDLPVRLLTAVGALGIAVSLIYGSVIVMLKWMGQFEVPGYAATMITVMFFGGLNMLGLGIVGSYAWRAYENTKQRPMSLTMSERSYPATTRQPPPGRTKG